MRALLLYPRFPRTFWSFDSILKLVGKKALLPPLGLVTVAAMLPETWDLRLVDCNVRDISRQDWDWADTVLLTAMIVQKDHLYDLIREAKSRGKTVVVGGPFVTSTPGGAEAAGADYLVLDEGEITIPAFLEDISRSGWRRRAAGQPAFRMTAGTSKPELTRTPVPRFDLLELPAYDGMAVQFSRGCPFLCEFCDIITLYGRRPRTKTPDQLLAELDVLYRIGWRGPVFLVDDNFIGNKPNIRKLLPRLVEWQTAHDFPFSFDTEASIDLAADADLMRLMVEAGFSAVFVGIETPDADSLQNIRKHQNNRSPMAEALRIITRAGLRGMIGMIIGFDGEKPGADQRIIDFVEETAVPLVIVSMLQALPNTALWTRLERENRLLDHDVNLNQTDVMNFRPTRPVREIAREFLRVFDTLYDPQIYLDRTFRHFQMLERPPRAVRRNGPAVAWDRPKLTLGLIAAAIRQQATVINAFAIICWRQGIVRKTRSSFWRYLWTIGRTKPHLLETFFVVCAHLEHFLEFRDLVRRQVTTALDRDNGPTSPWQPWSADAANAGAHPLADAVVSPAARLPATVARHASSA